MAWAGQFLAHFAIVLLEFLHIVWGQQFSDTCDWTFWGSTLEPEGIRHIYPSCSEGRLDWKQPHGAIRLTFQIDSSGSHFQACFVANVQFTSVKISKEDRTDHQDSFNGFTNLQHLVTLDTSNLRTPRETCLRSNGARSITLYIEAVQTELNSNVIGEFSLEYDLQRTSTNSILDSLEECRPCTEEEIFTAVCSHDFVVAGEIGDVFHHEQAQESHIHLHVSKIHRQRHRLFKRNTELSSSQNLASELHFKNYDGVIVTPHKCRIKKGAGEFLFMGHIRLKRAILKCAPRLEDFVASWSRAQREGRNPCVLD